MGLHCELSLWVSNNRFNNFPEESLCEILAIGDYFIYLPGKGAVPVAGRNNQGEIKMSNHNIEKGLNGDTVVDKAQDVAIKAKDMVSETTSVAMEQAKRAAAQVGEQAKTTVDSRMSDVAQELGSVADAVRQTSFEVGGESQTVAQYGERIAEQLDGVSSYLNEKGVEDVLTDLQAFARRQPAVFLGGAFMLGIVVGRFIRSSGSHSFNFGEDDPSRTASAEFADSAQQSGSTSYGKSYDSNRTHSGFSQESYGSNS